MGAVSVILLAGLLGDVAWISEGSDDLIVVSHCDEGGRGVSADSVNISVISILVNSLHEKSEFLGPSSPRLILECRSRHNLTVKIVEQQLVGLGIE